MAAASSAEGIVLQPLWKIHNVDWSVRRNVFEKDLSCPNLDLLRRNKLVLSRYLCYNVIDSQLHPIDSQGEGSRGRAAVTSSNAPCTDTTQPLHPSSRWSRFSLDPVSSSAPGNGRK